MVTGRLYAHVKPEEMKQSVQFIADKEKEGSQQKPSNRGQGIYFDSFDVDYTFKLPYGVGYDKVIKKKTDFINKQKVKNNLVMDELVQKLGYMDFRDALACNKYILDTKRHTDYHQ